MTIPTQLALTQELDTKIQNSASRQFADASDKTSRAKMKKPRSSLPPNVEMDTHMKFSSGVTSGGLLPSVGCVAALLKCDF